MISPVKTTHICVSSRFFSVATKSNLPQGVTELKAIFLDFAQLVRDQQAGIDEIEKNIDAVRLVKTLHAYFIAACASRLLSGDGTYVSMELMVHAWVCLQAHARVEAGMKDIMYADKMHREIMCTLS